MKKMMIILCLVLLLAGAIVVAALLWRVQQPLQSGDPTLTVETPPRLSKTNDEEFVLDVGISCLGEALYPAMSMSLSFDPARLEFLGVEEGNVFVLSNETAGGYQLPSWNYDVATSNATGMINIMYLDMTGGKCAFTQNLLAEEDNVLLRLKFRMRGSVRAGDVMNLMVEDAVFAASDERESLAMTLNTLKVIDGKIVIGE